MDKSTCEINAFPHVSKQHERISSLLHWAPCLLKSDESWGMRAALSHFTDLIFSKTDLHWKWRSHKARENKLHSLLQCLVSVVALEGIRLITQGSGMISLCYIFVNLYQGLTVQWINDKISRAPNLLSGYTGYISLNNIFSMSRQY